MARTAKNRDKVGEAKQPDKEPDVVWRAGVYARLSVDQDERKNESIETQLMTGKEYISRCDDIRLVECYTDLGKSGTSFEREGFQKMMTDVRQHKINCIIVKDFSRFGRNYIETGNYMEKIFPCFHVRFISVLDGYDSHRKHGTNDMLAVQLKNIVNELYAMDCSEKIRAIKKAKLEQGCYVGGIPPYGYCAGRVKEKRVLFPEDGASDVVRKIYELFDQGSRISEITAYLYEQRIHRPKEYRITGHVWCEEGETLQQWSDSTIRSVLTNYVYIGTLIQNRMGKTVYCGQGKRCLEPNEVVMAEHAHEPIVGEALFFRVSSRMEERRGTETEEGQGAVLRKKKLPKDNHAEDRYRSFLYCGVCGRKLKRVCTLNAKSNRVSVRTYAYGCPDTGGKDGRKCGNYFLTENTVNQVVMEILQKEFERSGICTETFVAYGRALAEQEKSKVRKMEANAESRLREWYGGMSLLYIQYKEDKFDRSVFLERKKDRETIKRDLENELLKYREYEVQIEKKEEETTRFFQRLWEEREAEVLSRELLQCLIKKITIYKDKKIEIVLNFRSG